MSLCKSAPSVRPQSVSDEFAYICTCAGDNIAVGWTEEVVTHTFITHTFGLLLCQVSP